MKHIWLVICGSWKRNKGANIGITVLMFVVSLSFVLVYNVARSSKEHQKELRQEIGYGDYWAELLPDKELAEFGTSADEIIDNLRDLNEVVGTVKSIKSYSTTLKMGNKSTDLVYMLEQNNGKLEYPIYDGHNNRIYDLTLGENEICVPKCFESESMYNVNIGDYVVYRGNDAADYKLKIVGFIEDPFMGSSMMGIKTAIIGEKTARLMDEQLAGDKNYLSCVNYICISKANPDMRDSEFEKLLNQKTSFFSYTNISLSSNQSAEYTMSIVNLFSAIAIVFIIVLLVTAFIVIGHSISSSIEQDYVNYGIYKAVGMTNLGIRVATAISYSIVSLIGLLLGIPAAIPLIHVMNDIMSKSTGLFTQVHISVWMTVAMMFVTLLTILLFVMLWSHKIVSITPVVALNEGRKNVNFDSLINLKISKKFLGFSIAYRQFSSKIMKYISIIIITALLAIFMIIMNKVYAFSNNGKEILRMFSCNKYDAYISYHLDKEAEVDELIKEYTDYEMYNMYSTYLLLDDVQTLCMVNSNPEYYSQILEGRTCLYDNEIVVTPYIAKSFDLSVGDKVKVTVNGYSGELLVSGIFVCPSDMGKSFGMGSDAMKVLYESAKQEHEIEDVVPDDVIVSRYLLFDDPSKMNDIKKTILDKYGEKLDNTTAIVAYKTREDAENTSSLLGDFDTGIKSTTAIVYVLGAIFIFISISLVASKVMYSERKDYGIYKSIGMPSGGLRRQISFRFMVVGIIGSLIGCVIGFFVTEPLLRMVFFNYGVPNYTTTFTAWEFIFPIIFVGALGYLCTYALSRKIKKVEPRILIVE